MEKNKENIMKILQNVKGEDFQEEHGLISSGFLDSFELLTFIQELEEGFNICIPLERISQEEFNNIDSVYELIRKIAENNNKEGTIKENGE